MIKWFISSLCVVVWLVSCSVVATDHPTMPTACRLPVEATTEWYFNYTNVQFDDKVYSVTAAHLAPFIDQKPLVIDEDNDIVIYENLGCATVYEIGSLPNVGEELIIAGQFYKQDMWYKEMVAGIVDFAHIMDMVGNPGKGSFVGLAGTAYPGMSGSPVFNKYGKFVGSISSGHVVPMFWGYSGLNFITRVDTITNMLAKLAVEVK